MGEVVRIALVSDSHGNAVGLEAALSDLAAHPADHVVYLGDAVQGGVQPAEVAQILREANIPVIMGNSDSFIVTGESKEEVPPAVHEIRDWTRDQLGADGLAFVETFLPAYRMELPGGRSLLCFHGSPKSFDDVILPETPDDELAGFLDGNEASVFAGGHTHLQWMRTVENDSLILNPGSAGAAYNRHLTLETFYIYPQAEYAILNATESHISVEFCRVPFDADVMEKIALASGHPNAQGESRRYRPRG